jgi:hypothetical protein
MMSTMVSTQTYLRATTNNKVLQRTGNQANPRLAEMLFFHRAGHWTLRLAWYLCLFRFITE